MKKRTILALLALCTSVFSGEISIDKNLTFWQKRGKNIVSDPVIKTSKNCSIRLTSYSSATRKLKLEKGCEYEISFNIRGKGISTGLNQFKVKTAAYLILRGNKRARLIGKLETGSFDWKRSKGTFSSDSFGTTDVTLALVMRGDGTVWFDDIVLKKVRSGSREQEKFFRHDFTNDLKELAVIPEGVFGFFKPGEQIRFTIHLDPYLKDLQFKFKVRDENGRTVYTQNLKKIGKSCTLPGQQSGYYVADFEFYRKNKKISEFQSAFAVHKVITKRDPFFSGGFGAYHGMFEGLKRIGMGSINMKVHTSVAGRTLTAKELVDFNMRQQNRFIRSGDFRLAAVFTGTVVQKDNPSREKIKAGFPVSTDAYWENYAKVAELYVKRNRGKIQDYVIQSEIPSQAGHKERNCGTFTEAMFNLMISSRIVSRIVRRLDPEVPVWFGGNNRMEYQNTTERIVAEDLVKEIDGLIIDAYTGNWYLAPGVGYRIPEEKLEEFLKMASDLSLRLGLPKGRVIRNEELGYAMRYGERFDGRYAFLQAALSARNLILTKASSAQIMEIHTPMRYLPKRPGNKDRYMGLVWRPVWFKTRVLSRHNVVPLPGGAMYAAAASELAFAQYRDKVISSGLYAYLFTRPDGQTLAALWNTEKKLALSLKLPVNARLVNMYGRERSLQAGSVSLEVGPGPCYLTLPLDVKKTHSVIQEAFQKSTPECVCKAYYDTKDRIKVFVRNQTGRILQGKLVFPGMKEKVIRILPGKVASCILPVRSGGKLISDGGRVYPVELEQSSIHAVRRIPDKPLFDGSGNWFRNLKYGLLKYPEAIRPSDALQEERCYFKTPGNPNGHSVSAKYWTAYDQKNFYLAVEVDDPVHLQRYSKFRLWQDDSVQFSFTTEEFVPKLFRSLADRDQNTEHSYCVGLTKNGVEYCKMRGADAGLKKYPAKITRKNAKTLYEIAIPLKVFGKSRPKRFGFVVFDNNYPALKIAPYWLEFSPGVTSHKDASYLKLLDWQ